MLRITLYSLLLSSMLLLSGCLPEQVDWLSLHADQTQITQGDSVTLTWEFALEEGMTLHSARLEPGVGPVDSAGSFAVAPNQSTRYALMATILDAQGNSQTGMQLVDVQVNAADDNPGNDGGSGSPGTDEPPSTAWCFCPDDIGVNRGVLRPNGISRSTGDKTLEVLRVTMPNMDTPHSLPSIKRATTRFIDWHERLSRGRLTYQFRDAREVRSNATNCSSAKNDAESARRKSTFVTIITVPCGPQHASISKSKVHIKQNIQMIRQHEVGHVLGLNHSGTWDRATNTNVRYGDGSSSMSRYAGPGYTISQLHGLGWTDPHDTVRINDYLTQGGYFEGTLRALNKNKPGQHPLAFVYDQAHNDRRIWISAPYTDREHLYVHTQRLCDGCSGMYMHTTRLEIIKQLNQAVNVAGLSITLTQVQSLDDETHFNVQVRPANERSTLVAWDFNDKQGTKLTDLASRGVVNSGNWEKAIGKSKTTGQGTLVFKSNNTSLKKSSTWFNLSPAGQEINRGKAWLGMRINRFTATGKANERLRFGLVSESGSTAVLGEWQLFRGGRHPLELAQANDASGNTVEGIAVSATDSLEKPLEIVMEFDFDAAYFQVFYRTAEDQPWLEVGDRLTIPAALLKKSPQTALRLASEGDFTQHASEGVEIDDIFVQIGDSPF